jgi:hypothetical protein
MPSGNALLDVIYCKGAFLSMFIAFFFSFTNKIYKTKTTKNNNKKCHNLVFTGSENKADG